MTLGYEFMQPSGGASPEGIPPGWLAQPKVDGWRTLIEMGKHPMMRTRRGLVRPVPPLVAERLPKGNYLLDAELYDPRVPWSLRGGSVPSLACHDVNLYVAVFDVLRVEDTDMRVRPLIERWQILQDLCKPLLIYTDTPAQVWASVLALGAEGMVAKNPASIYMAGRSDQWRKVKNRTVTEVTVEGWLAEGGGWACVTPDGRRLRLDNVPNGNVMPNLRLRVEHTGLDARGRMVEPQIRGW